MIRCGVLRRVVCFCWWMGVAEWSFVLASGVSFSYGDEYE